MAPFSFFSSRKKDIARLIEQSRLLFDAASKQKFAEQVSAVFNPLIEGRQSKTERADERLQHTILFELCGLISTLPFTDTYFVEHYKTVLDELIDACRWKLQIKDIQVDELDRNSMNRQRDIWRWVARIRERQKASHVKRLTLMLSQADQQAVAYRTLRAFLVYLNRQNQAVHATALFWLRDGRVQLRISLLREYLFEQIALRVYLFHTTSEAGFIEESLSKVKHWVTAQVTGLNEDTSPELTEGINDIVSQVKIDFINKCQRKMANPEAFFLDARLTTYLIGFVKKNKAVSKLLAAQKQDGEVARQANEDAGDEYTQYDNDRPGADDLMDDTLAFEPLDQWEDERNIVRTCLQLLCDACRELIMRHYNDSFSQPVPFNTLAIEFGESAKTLESRYKKCMEHLKNIVHDAYKKQQLSIYPR